MRNLFENAVRMQLRSDVPVGVFLSGGIDSSSVLSLASLLKNSQIETFSAVFKFGNNYDESQYSRLVAKEFNSKHHEVIVSPKEFREFITKFIWYHEEPTTDPSGIPLYFIAKLARDHVKVILSGEGSDELFAGYDVYKYLKIIEQYRRIPEFLRAFFVKTFASNINEKNKVKFFLKASSLPLEQRYFGIKAKCYELEFKSKLLSEEFKNSVDLKESLSYFSCLYNKVKNEEYINKILYVDNKIWLPNDILIKSDRMSMAASIELRVPFLDNEIVNFASSLPASLKMSRYTGKYVLRQAMKDLIPKKILKRKKMGFPVPVGVMLMNEIKDDVLDILLSSCLRERRYYNLEKCLKEHLQGKADHAEIIWEIFIP